MGTKPGSSSLPAPPRDGADLSAHALAVVGILASLVFVGGSAMLNYRMGFTSADNVTDGTIYGSLAAAGDGLKAMAPFAAACAWKRRQWPALAAAVTVFAVFTAYSFTSSLGFSSQHRAHKDGSNTAAMERHRDARRQIDRDRARLDALGPQRGAAELAQAIDNVLKSPVGTGRWTVGQLSDGCARNKPLTRQACAKIATLKEEKLRSDDAERLAAEVKALTAQTGNAPVVGTADPQADALTFLGRTIHLLPPAGQTSDAAEETQTGYGLALLMAVFIELGSGLGLFVATTPWRTLAPKPPQAESLSPSLPAIAAGPPIESFAAERLQRKQGHELHLAVAFEAYKEWCEQRNKSMQGRSRFDRGLLRLARELDLDVDSGLSGWVIRDVALRNAPFRLR